MATTSYDAEDFVEIYETDSADDAERLADLVLRPEGIEVVVHDRMSKAFPTPSTESGEVTLAVPAADKDKASALLKEYLDGLKEGPPKRAT